MKNNIIYNLLLLMLLMATMSFTSCKDDEDDNSKKVYKSCPDEKHPHMIDLGLPSGTKWACCNVGASSPEGYGGYYAWGETAEKGEYTWENYAYFDSHTDDLANIGSDIAGTQYDVAHVKWSGGWHMPTQTQIQELVENATSEWTYQNDVAGIKIMGSNGGTIFLPAAGFRWESFSSAGSSGYYWSSASDPSYSHGAYNLYFSSDGTYTDNGTRFIGRNVRPVVRK